MRKKLTALVTSLLMMSSLLTTAFAGDFAAVAHDHTHDDACLEIATEAVHIDVHDHTHDDACLEMATEAVHIDVHDHTHDDNCHDEEIVKTLESVEYNAPAQAVELSVISATAHTHNYTLKRSTVAPTCTSRGYTVYRCTRCTETIKKDYTPAKGHNYTQNAGTIRSATCTGSGLVIKKCSRCSSTIQVNTSALGHSYSSVSYAATCTSPARTVTTCTRCGISSSTTSGTVAGHNFSQFVKTTKAATCTEAGSATYKCSRCSATTSKTVNALGHSYSVKTVAPTCTADGYNLHTCTRSGCTKSYKSNTISKLGHNYTKYVKTTKAATCTEKGAKTYKCSRCSATTSKTVNALGHSCSVKTVAPTCTADGYNLHTCTRSGCTYSYKSNIISKLGHSLKSTNYAATCTSPARTTTVCTRSGCNHNSTTTSGQPLGHNFTRYVNTIKQASCYESGSATYQCTRCLKNTTKTINATGHTYSTNTIPADCTQPERVEKKCVRCSYVAMTTTVGQPLGHKFNIYVETIKEPTCSEEGQARYQCTRCTKSTVETLDKLPCQYEIVGLYKPATCTTHQLDVQQCTGCGNILYGVPNYDAPFRHEFEVYSYWGEDYVTGDESNQFYNGFENAPAKCRLCGETVEHVDFRVTGIYGDDFSQLSTWDIADKSMDIYFESNHPVIVRASADWLILKCNGKRATTRETVVSEGMNCISVTVDVQKMFELLNDVNSLDIYSAAIDFSVLLPGGEFTWENDCEESNTGILGYEVNVFASNINKKPFKVYKNSIQGMVSGYSEEVQMLMYGLKHCDDIRKFTNGSNQLAIYSPVSGNNQVHFIEYNVSCGTTNEFSGANTKVSLSVNNGYKMSLGNNGDNCIISSNIMMEHVDLKGYDATADAYITNGTTIVMVVASAASPFIPTAESSAIISSVVSAMGTVLSMTDVISSIDVLREIRQGWGDGNTPVLESAGVALSENCYLDGRVDNSHLTAFYNIEDVPLDYSINMSIVAYEDEHCAGIWQNQIELCTYTAN